jgi:hypothetical protein
MPSGETQVTPWPSGSRDFTVNDAGRRAVNPKRWLVYVR